MSTTTTNYGFTLPAVADPIDEDLWGTELNTNFSSLDDILPTPAANKYGAIAVQNSSDNGLDYITSQGTSGQVLLSNGADALPSFQSLTAAMLSAIYPVGSYYLNETDSTNPGTLFGFGTWVAVTDKFLVAHGSTYTATGGAATVTLTSTELPAHTHKISSNTGATGFAVSDIGTGSIVSGGDLSSGGANTKKELITTSAGSGAAFSIIPPYQAVYVWKRTV